MGFDREDDDPISSWLAYLDGNTAGDVRLLAREVGDGPRDGVALVGLGNGRRVEVVVSRYDDRDPPTVIAFEPTYLSRVRDEARQDAGQDGCYAVVVLDVYGEGRVVPERDHFMVLTDVDGPSRISLRVLGPGEYDGVPSSRVDRWEPISRD